METKTWSEHRGGVVFSSLQAEIILVVIAIFMLGSFMLGAMLRDSLSIALVEDEVIGSTVILS